MPRRFATATDAVDAAVTACFTGYRPKKLPWGYDESSPACAGLKAALFDAVNCAYERGYRAFLCGMAEGVDVYAAEAVLSFKEGHGDVSLILALPYPDFGDKRSAAERARYKAIAQKADGVVTVSAGYHAGCMSERNRFMVDSSSLVIAVFDGSPGGTANTVKYAKASGRDIETILPGIGEILKWHF